MRSTPLTRQQMSGTDVPLSNVECLLLAQAVYEYGANAWQQVSKLLSKHPLLSRPKHFYSSNSCRDIYARLLNEAQLECSDENNTAHAAVNLKLAQKFYSARLVELRDLIAAEEVKFKTIVAEIRDIRDGKWDAQIRTKFSRTEIVSESEVDHAVPYDVPGNSHELEQQSNEQHVEEPERPVTPQPEEEPKGPEVIEPEPEPSEKELSYPPQSEDHESESDEQLKIEVQPIEVDEPSASTHEETEQMEEDQQLASQDDEASEIEAILTPEPPEGSAEGEAREQSTEHDESPGHEHETPDREEEVTSSTQDAETPHAEQEHETPMDVDAEGRDVSVDAEASLPGKRKVSDGEEANEREKKRPREESSPPTPEEEEEGTRSQRGTTSSEQRPGPSTPAQSTPSASTAQAQALPNKRFQTVITLLHSQISQHRNGNIFHNPIKPSEAPDYHEIIKRPMDLKTIKARIKDSVIRTSTDFQRDVYLMFANAMMYNRPGSDIALMAEEMMLESEVHINTFRQTEGYLRNTRA